MMSSRAVLVPAYPHQPGTGPDSPSRTGGEDYHCTWAFRTELNQQRSLPSGHSFVTPGDWNRQGDLPADGWRWLAAGEGVLVCTWVYQAKPETSCSSTLATLIGMSKCSTVRGACPLHVQRIPPYSRAGGCILGWRAFEAT